MNKEKAIKILQDCIDFMNSCTNEEFEDYHTFCFSMNMANDSLLDRLDFDSPENAMIEFAKYHVNLALQSAAENAEVSLHTESWGDYETSYNVNKNSILNAYPLENIV